MARRIYTPERIINKLRKAEIFLSQGSSVGEAARKIGIGEQIRFADGRIRGDEDWRGHKIKGT